MAVKARLSEIPEVELDFWDITKTTATLKEFLRYHDHDPLFAPVKEAGRIGIPLFLLEDGTRTLELQQAKYRYKRYCSVRGLF